MLFRSTVEDSATVVGESDVATGDSHAFVWQAKSGMKDLNSLIPTTGSGWAELERAYGVNNAGWIVGQGQHAAGQWRAFLLIPSTGGREPTVSAAAEAGPPPARYWPGFPRRARQLTEVDSTGRLCSAHRG